MKKIVKNIIEKMVMIPLPIFLVVVAVLNYELGSLMAEINGTYSKVSEISKNEFFTELISTIALWTVLCIFNAIITKISNMKMLNKNYMKWIEKLTYSKVSSITSGRYRRYF